MTFPPILDITSLNRDQEQRISNAFQRLSEAIHEVALAEDELDTVRSRSKRDKGLFEQDVRKRRAMALKAERQARRELNQTIFEILGLSSSDRQQIENGLAELQEIRRSRMRNQ